MSTVIVSINRVGTASDRLLDFAIGSLIIVATQSRALIGYQWAPFISELQFRLAQMIVYTFQPLYLSNEITLALILERTFE